MPKKENEAPYDFATARLSTTSVMPYLTQHVMSLLPQEKPGIGTMAVDKYGRCYYDPTVLDKWSMEECGGVILHEDAHVWMDHHRRAERHLGDNANEQELLTWNIAGDVSINQMLADANVKLPEGCVYPKTFNLPENLSTEEYYNLLQEKKVVQTQTIKVAGHGGGSASDGKAKPWEDGPPNDKAPGLDEFEQERLKRVMAHAIDEYCQDSNRRGTVPGELRRFAEHILRPQVDPRRELLAQVKYALNCINGYGITTWKKLNRRVPPGAMRLPAHLQPFPRVCLIVDTSGSMGQDDLGLALGVIASVVKALSNSHEGLTVVTGDTHAASCQKVFGARAVELMGGGGTDMGHLIKECAAHRPGYDVIIVCSDGETPWCEPVNARVVACLTRRSSHKDYAPPAWIKTVYIKPCEEAA